MRLCALDISTMVISSAVLATVLVAFALLRVCAQLEVLGALDRFHPLGLALGALKLQHNLLGRLCLLVENRLGLPTEAGLLLVVTALSLGGHGRFAGLVLGHLMRSVLLALAAVSLPDLWDVHHGDWSERAQRKLNL